MRKALYAVLIISAFCMPLHIAGAQAVKGAGDSKDEKKKEKSKESAKSGPAKIVGGKHAAGKDASQWRNVVSVRTAQALSQVDTKTTGLSIQYGNGIADNELSVLSKFNDLTLLRLWCNTAVMPDEFKNFKPITATTIKRIASLKSLEQLDLMYPVSRADLKSLSKLKNLTKLRLVVDSTFDDKIGVELGSFSTIKHFELEGAREIGEQTLGALGKMKSLTHLSIDGKLRQKFLFKFDGAAMKDLTDYVLAHSDRAILHHNMVPNLDATGSSIRGWKKLKNLRFLSIESFEAFKDDKLAAAVSDLKHLETVWIYGCQHIGDKTARALSSHDGLTDITLDHCSVSESGMLDFGGMKTLEKLSLRGNNTINDSALTAISKSTTLKSLEFSSTNVTSQGVAVLAGLKDTLTELRDFHQMQLNVSKQAVVDLRAAMPNTTIR